VVDQAWDKQEDTPWMAGWEDQEANTLDSSLAATPLQRLEWLEEALALAWAGQESTSPPRR
jgi:hypothetical protein